MKRKGNIRITKDEPIQTRRQKRSRIDEPMQSKKRKIECGPGKQLSVNGKCEPVGTQPKIVDEKVIELQKKQKKAKIDLAKSQKDYTHMSKKEMNLAMAKDKSELENQAVEVRKKIAAENKTQKAIKKALRQSNLSSIDAAKMNLKLKDSILKSGTARLAFNTLVHAKATKWETLRKITDKDSEKMKDRLREMENELDGKMVGKIDAKAVAAEFKSYAKRTAEQQNESYNIHLESEQDALVKSRMKVVITDLLENLQDLKNELLITRAKQMYNSSYLELATKHKTWNAILNASSNSGKTKELILELENGFHKFHAKANRLLNILSTVGDKSVYSVDGEFHGLESIGRGVLARLVKARLFPVNIFPPSIILNFKNKISNIQEMVDQLHAEPLRMDSNTVPKDSDFFARYLEKLKQKKIDKNYTSDVRHENYGHIQDMLNVSGIDTPRYDRVEKDDEDDFMDRSD